MNTDKGTVAFHGSVDSVVQREVPGIVARLDCARRLPNRVANCCRVLERTRRTELFPGGASSYVTC